MDYKQKYSPPARNYQICLSHGRYLAIRGGEWVENGTPDLFDRDTAHEIATNCGYRLTLHPVVINDGEYRLERSGFGIPPYEADS